MKSKVIVGMSGGVDSMAAAYLLRQEGYEVVGLTLRTWEAEDGSESRCCEMDDARRAAGALGIPWHPLNCLTDFQKYVTEPFVENYLQGLTPNPCIECNRYVKWERMLYMAKVLRADYVATGHYASLICLDNGRYTVKKALHAEKDQTYMLYRLTQEQLKATLLPLGLLSKETVRKIAEDAALPAAQKPDSQEICFVPDGHYSEYVVNASCGKAPPEGFFVDEEGKVLGKHKGIIYYTVGQRRGLGLPLGYPAFVTKIDADRNVIIIGRDSSLLTSEICCERVNYMGIPPLAEGEAARVSVKIRYHHQEQPAELICTGPGQVRVIFDEPVRAAAPGQSAVFYDENGCVAGGGIIRRDG